MNIPYPINQIDIFSYGFNKRLNRTTNSQFSSLVYNPIDSAISPGQVYSGGLLPVSVIKSGIAGQVEFLQSDTRYSVYNAKKENLTNSAANSILKITCGANGSSGGAIEWSVYFTNNNHVQNTSGVSTWSATNKGGTFTSQATDSVGSTAASSGTLTGAWSVVATSATEFELRFTPTSSLTEAATYTLFYRVNSLNFKNITIL